MKKRNLKLNFELKNGRYVCKICGESVAATHSRHYLNHFRSEHPDLCEKIVPRCQASWPPEQVAELVRIVGDYIRQNKNPIYLRGNKAINWDHIAEQMKHSNGCQLSVKQISRKLDNMVFRLTNCKTSIEEVGEQEWSETNGYVFLIKYLLHLKWYNQRIRTVILNIYN